MEKLNSDIVLKILSGLPKTNTCSESVLQCREVSKLWRNLLGKPKTGMLFVNRPIYDCECDIKLYYTEESSFTCIEEPRDFYKTVREIGSIQTDAWPFKFIGTCNGLVCYAISEFIYIYNPITGERIRIPNTSLEFDADPVGFGYCHSSNTYKVVKIGGATPDGKRSVKVYTLGDGIGWRDKPEITFKFLKWGVFANGAIYWLNTRSDCDIVAFDLADESFKSVHSPQCHTLPNSHINVHLGSLLGRNVYMCLHYKEQGERMMDIWVFEKNNMNNCGRSIEESTDFNSFTWVRLFSRKWDKSFTRLLSRTESEIVLWEDGVLSCYDPTDFEKIWEVEGAKGNVYEAVAHAYSLVSLKNLGEERVDRLVLPKKIEDVWL